MRGSDEGTKVLLLGSHRRRPNRTRSIKQKDRPKVVENLSEFKRAETKFPSDDVRRRRRRSERKRRVWKLLPDGKIFRGDSEPSESQHVSARFSHSSGLCPCDLIDGQSFPLRRQLRFVGGPACSNRVALELIAGKCCRIFKRRIDARCHGRGPYGRPCSQNNQKPHTKSGMWLRSRRNRIAPISFWGPALALPHGPSRISGRQKSLLS